MGSLGQVMKAAGHCVAFILDVVVMFVICNMAVGISTTAGGLVAAVILFYTACKIIILTVNLLAQTFFAILTVLD